MSQVICQHQQQVYRFGRGGSDEEHQKHQADISVLLDNHNEIQREICLLADGFTATTTSTNPLIVKHLHDHVSDMKARFAKGRAIRSWDPVYALLFAYKDDIQISYQMRDDGVYSKVTTKNVELIELLHAHAQEVSGFVREGRAIAGESYPISEKLTQLLELKTK